MVRVVARSRVRLFERAVLRELVGDAAAEPLEVLAEGVARYEPADEQAEEERLGRVRLRGEPRVERLRARGGDPVEPFLGSCAVPRRPARDQPPLRELREQGIELRLRRRPHVADRLRDELHQVVARPLALHLEQRQDGGFRRRQLSWHLADDSP